MERLTGILTDGLPLAAQFNNWLEITSGTAFSSLRSVFEMLKENQSHIRCW
ncbi:hypothetical protein KJ762_02890 [bacterium]|nr:hypothetical protein [bacterium]MBU1633438.1 hypothetical protein [bacterium]MBU1873464.1 hypothetical protein [bacterium]